MKTSILLFDRDHLETYPYLQYIYDAIVEAGRAKGPCLQLEFHEVSYQKLAADSAIGLLTIELPSQDKSLKKKLWQRFNFPQLVRLLNPSDIYYLDTSFSPLKQAGGVRQWAFVADLESSLPPVAREQSPSRQQLHHWQKRQRQLLRCDVWVSYSQAAGQALRRAFAESTARLMSWLPIPVSGNEAQEMEIDIDKLTAAFKKEHTDAESYFLMDARGASVAEVVTYLKAFSHFKKWQRSSMRLVLVLSPALSGDADFRLKFDTYFYKDDVHLLSGLDLRQLGPWLQAAYAVVTPAGDRSLDVQLAAAAKGSVVIAPDSASVQELLPGAVFILAATGQQALGQMLVTAYKSEILRSRHIRAALECSKAWTRFDVQQLQAK